MGDGHDWPGVARIELPSGSAEDTRAIGRRLARGLRAGDVLLLHGHLGAGKTTFAQGVAAGLGVAGPVQSPTFTLVNEHAGPLRLYHLDLYRLTGPGDLAGLGYEEYLDPVDGVSVVEWPERAGGLLPETYLLATFSTGPDDERRIALEAVGDRAAADRWLGTVGDET